MFQLALASLPYYECDILFGANGKITLCYELPLPVVWWRPTSAWFTTEGLLGEADWDRLSLSYFIMEEYARLLVTKPTIIIIIVIIVNIIIILACKYNNKFACLVEIETTQSFGKWIIDF